MCHMEEVFAIYNEKGKIIGAATRAEAHKKGLWHMVVHCWVVFREEQNTWIYFQQRADSKKDFPGFYDIASTGHVDASELHAAAVVREASEEIGMDVSGERLHYLGETREEFCKEDFLDREIVQIYLYDASETPVFAPGEEVSRMVRVSREEFEKKVLKGEPQITAYTMQGKKVTILEEEWCRHQGEYKKWVLPWLKSHKKEGGEQYELVLQ